jgi:hypothetical protein
MADIKIIETFDDSNVLAELDKIEQALQGVDAAAEATGASLSDMYKQGEVEAKNFNTAVDKTAASVARQSQAVKAAEKSYGGLKNTIKETALGIQIGGRSIGEWVEQLNTFRTVGKAATGTAEGMTVAQRILNLTLKAFPLIAIISVIISAITYFAKFQDGIDKVSRVIAAVNAVIDRFVQNVGNVGKAIVSIFSGNFEQGFKDLAVSVTQLSDGLVDAASKAYELEAAFQALRDAQLASSTELERQAKAYEKLRDIGADDTLAARERLKALRDAANTEENIAVQRVTFARQNVDLIRQQNALLTDSVERRQTLADAEKELIEVEAESASQQRQIQQEIRQIQQQQREEARQVAEERRKEIEKLRKEYEQLLKSVEQQNRALAQENEFNPVKRVNEEWRQAIREAEALRKQLLKLAPTQEDAVFVDQQISELFGRINKKYEEQLIMAQDELEKIREKITAKGIQVLPQTEAWRSEIQFQNQAFIALLKTEYERDLVPAIEQILTEIADVFSLRGNEVISVDEAKQIFSNLKSAFADAAAGYEQLGEIQIEQQQRKVDKLQAEFDKQAEIVQKQKELSDLGLSNDLAIEEKRLRQTQALRDAAEKKRLDLARRAANQQLAIDSLQQASSLATAAGNVIKAESNKGLLGVAFAISAIAFLFKIFTQAKANALKFSEPQKLRKGDRLSGPSHEQDGIDIYIAGESRPRYNAEGGEWVVNRDASAEHDAHLRAINSGKYKGVDLGKAIMYGRAFEQQSALISRQAPSDSDGILMMIAKGQKQGADQIVAAIRESGSDHGDRVLTRQGAVVTVHRKG